MSAAPFEDLMILAGVSVVLQAAVLFYVLLLIFQPRVRRRYDRDQLDSRHTADKGGHPRGKRVVDHDREKAHRFGCCGEAQVGHGCERRSVPASSDAHAAEERRDEQHGDYLCEHCCCLNRHDETLAERAS